MRLRFVLVLLSLFLVACAAADDELAPASAGDTSAAVLLPEQCRGDGAVQTWLLLPVDPPNSDLLAAYQARQVIEFQAQVLGSNDDVARTPHRAFILGEAAEGITLTLDYQGDPPPLVLGQSYRMVAWSYPTSATTTQASPITEATVEADPIKARAELEEYQSYELQVFDEAGLLFLGATDADLQDDPLGIVVEPAESDCPVVPASTAQCVTERQVQPLRLRWGEDAITLYPGEDGELRHGGSVYQVSLFRSRLVRYAEPACPGYLEHQRSLRIERIAPPPVLPASPPITATSPITAAVPVTQPSP